MQYLTPCREGENIAPGAPSKDVEAGIIGRSYKYLIRKFAEGSGQSAHQRAESWQPVEELILLAHPYSAAVRHS